MDLHASHYHYARPINHQLIHEAIAVRSAGKEDAQVDGAIDLVHSLGPFAGFPWLGVATFPLPSCQSKTIWFTMETEVFLEWCSRGTVMDARVALDRLSRRNSQQVNYGAPGESSRWQRKELN